MPRKRRPPANSIVAEYEDVAEQVAQYAVDSMDAIVEALVPDGAGFGQRRLSEREQMRAYLGTATTPPLRGNPEAWREWIKQKAEAFQQSLQELLESMEVEPDFVTTLHPWDIATRAAIAYSARMERLIGRYSLKAQEQREQIRVESATPPLLPDDDEGEDESWPESKVTAIAE